MKKFYALVATQKEANGYKITLDGRPIKTKLKHDLLAPNQSIAQIIMQEWAGQGDEILPDTMPITQILNTRIDRVSAERKTMRDMVLKYLNTDLICYRTDAPPPELGQAQAMTWDPYLEWFRQHFGSSLATTTDLVALSQDVAAHTAVAGYIDGLDDDHFTVLQLITAIAGSIVLALAGLEGQADAQSIFTAIRVEENFKAKIYNEDFYGRDPAQDKKDNALRADLDAALNYLSMLKN